MEEIEKIVPEILEDICDIEIDFYGRQLAVGTSSGKLYLYDKINGKMSKTSEIIAHSGPIYKVSWSHPSFGPLLGTCGFDKKVNLFKLNSNYQLEKIYEHEMHENIVKYLKFNFFSNDLILISGGLDGNIILCQYFDKNFITEKAFAHDYGVNSIDFLDDKTFVTCGNDNTIKIWNYSLENGNIIIKNINVLKDNDNNPTTKDISVKDNKHFVCCGDTGEIGIVNYWILNEENNWERHEIYNDKGKVEKVKFNEEHTCIALIMSDGKEQLIMENEFNL